MSRYAHIAGRLRRVNGWRSGAVSTSPPLTLDLGELGDIVGVPDDMIPPAMDQGQIGDCVAQTLRELYYGLELRLGLTPREYSALDPYWWARNYDGTDPTDDAGTQIASAVAVASGRGVPLIEAWPDDRPFSLKPDAGADASAAQHKAILRFCLPNLYTMRACLAAGFGFGIGFDVQKQLMSDECAASGEATYTDDPAAFDGGGHAVTVWRHDRTKKIGAYTGAFLALNHWSQQWGLNGRFWLPEQYVLSGHASDAETIRMAEV